MSKLEHYLYQAQQLPPRQILQKGMRLVMRSVGDRLSYGCARLFGTRISDAQFRAALVPQLRDENDLRSCFDGNQIPRFFIARARANTVLTALRRSFPTMVTSVIAAADGTCGHIFDLLGSGPMPMGEMIDWHTDFGSGYRWDPEKYYTLVQRAPYPGGYDIKVPWELSRCQHFAWLGQAYWFTDDEKYAREFVAQVLDWIEQNPPRFGVNWACAMDVAIRVVNWLWGYHFFRGSTYLDEQFLLAFFKSLLSHGRHIMRNLEWSDTLTSNHYLSEIVGLIYLGIMLPQFKEAQHWREFGLQELQKEMFRQVYADGVDFEASTSYHRLVTEMFLSAVILARLNGYNFSQPFLERLEEMLDFVMYITKPDGTVPLIGDNDNGRLHRLQVWNPPEREWVDFRYLLAIGAVLFERADFAQAAGDQWEEAIWLLGQDALQFKEKIESRNVVPLELTSRAFADAGLYIVRDNDCYLVVGAGPNGQNGNGGHAHNDKLSFELYVNGQTWIVDPGAYVYTADYEARNRFRSTAFHNTVQVDSQEQNPLSPAQRDIFRLPDIARARATYWAVDKEYVLFAGEHYGYRRLQLPVVHRRIIFLDKLLSVWIIHDQLSARGQHQVVSHLHFAPDLDVKLEIGPEASLCVRGKGDAAGIFITALREGLVAPGLSTGAVSSGYGLQEPATVAAWHWDEQCKESVLAITDKVGYTEQTAAAYHRYVEVYKQTISRQAVEV